MLYENLIKMKRSNREQYYQNRSIAELKREAQNRNTTTGNEKLFNIYFIKFRKSTK